MDVIESLHTHTCWQGKKTELEEIFHEFHVVFGLCSGTSGLDCRELPSVLGDIVSDTLRRRSEEQGVTW
ncbi:hypothetical protein PC113_g25556 [Phytophthora cactorum]|uniref:Uncharacterized protein n=1 Tax=Phytophthora cactorum TaxID=29920 RepID=A0A8T0XY37_9STRA|nr:hypothetical protein PC113_g25556 [Phytophthora cactorum]